MDDDEDHILIRRANGADIEGLVASSAGLSEEDGALRDSLRDPQWPLLHAARTYADHLVNPAMLVLIAERDSELVGHLLGAYYDASDMWLAPRAHLISMFVRSPWRGRNVGSRLVGEFAAWAKSRGAVQLRVTAYTTNEGAIRFYRRHGFVPLESTLAAPVSDFSR